MLQFSLNPSLPRLYLTSFSPIVKRNYLASLDAIESWHCNAVENICARDSGIAKCQLPSKCAASECSDAFKALAEEEGTDGFANGDVTLRLSSGQVMEEPLGFLKAPKLQCLIFRSIWTFYSEV